MRQGDRLCLRARHVFEATGYRAAASDCAALCRFLPPPGSQEGLWAAVAALPLLRRLDLSHSHTVTPVHIALLTSLTALESLDLTGVHLPLSALAPLQCLTSVTQLRIPNVKVLRRSRSPRIPSSDARSV